MRVIYTLEEIMLKYYPKILEMIKKHHAKALGYEKEKVRVYEY